MVIPCYNEADRLDVVVFQALADNDGIDLCCVDDGSTDNTAELLTSLARDHRDIRVLSLPDNQGKGEAVRQGMLAALADGSPLIAYFDADLATPPRELVRIIEVLRSRDDIDAVIASRVLLLGRDLQRRRLRHYLGRVFATFAAIAVGAQVYDTQCGAKVFRSNDRLRSALAVPFASRWAFDVELLRRLIRPTSAGTTSSPCAVIEEPLMAWHDIAGSKLSMSSMLRSGVDVVGLAIQRLRGRS